MPRGKKYARRPRKPIRKAQRKAVARRRQPFVEQKQKDELISQSHLFQHGVNDVYVPHAFIFMTQGDTMADMNGRWIFSKWLTTQMTMTFDTAKDYNFPLQVRCRYGWCKLNLNPTDKNHNGNIGPMEVDILQQHVKAVVTNNYDDSTLLPQKARDVVTLGDFVIKNNPRLLENPTGGSITTFRQDKHLKFKWSPQRKIQYQKCENATGHVYYQCNQKNWVPFVHFTRVQAGTETPPTAAQMPKLNIGTRHYFTDS